MAVPPLSDNTSTLFTNLIEHHLRFSLAKRRWQLGKRDWYRVAALAVRDMLIERMLGDAGSIRRKKCQKTLLFIARIPDRALARKQSVQSRDHRHLPGVGWRETASTCSRCSTKSPTPRSAMAAWDGWRHAFSIRWRRWICPATATGSTTSSVCSGRRSATATRSSGRIAGGATISPWLVTRPEESCLIPVYGRIEHRFNRSRRVQSALDERRGCWSGCRPTCRSAVTAGVR